MVIILSLVLIFSNIIIFTPFLKKEIGTVFDSSNEAINKEGIDNSMFMIVNGLYGNEKSPYSLYSKELNCKEKMNLIPIKGKNIYLNIDRTANKIAYDALGEYEGAIIVYNYKTGQTICQTSKSNSNNNRFVDKCISDSFTPGSIMKIVTAICTIENMDDIFYKKYECNGQFDTKDGSVICNANHGKMDFRTAFTQSCNSTFSQIGIELGENKLNETAEKLGFNSCISCHGVKFKSSYFAKEFQSKADLGWAAVGQYTTKVTPAHFLSIVGAIANGGIGYAPDIIYSISYNKPQKCRKPEVAVKINSDTAKRLDRMLRANVHDKYGDERFENLTMCGKTGTAQVDGFDSHSWFVGYSQDEKFPYAVVCVVELGGAGYGMAIDVSNEVLQYINKG